MSNVVVVKIDRNTAGTKIPYDKLYFFRYEDRHLVPEVFSFALVMPVDDDMKHILSGLSTKYVRDYTYHKSPDTNLGTPTPFTETRGTQRAISDWWQAHFEEFDYENRVAVVPILPRAIRNKLAPTYLASPRWFREIHARSRRNKRALNVLPAAKAAISELAYLSTPFKAPNDKIRPLCSICPRLLLHVQGQCVPGQRICYSSLDFSQAVSTEETVSASV
jgi:hypothetical protein